MLDEKFIIIKNNIKIYSEELKKPKQWRIK